MASLASQKSTPLLVVLLAGTRGLHRATPARSSTTSASQGSGRAQGAGRRHRRTPSPRCEAATDSAKKELARGTVEDLRKRLDTYRGSLVAAPPAGAGAERGAQPARRHLEPQQDPRRDAVAGGAAAGGAGPGAVRHLQVQHVGHRALRSDRPVPGRRREPAADHRALRSLGGRRPTRSAAKALGDTSGSLLEAKFQVRTYVKSSSAEGEASGS